MRLTLGDSFNFRRKTAETSGRVGGFFPGNCGWFDSFEYKFNVCFGALEAFNKQPKWSFYQFDFLRTHVIAAHKHASPTFHCQAHPVNVVFSHFHRATYTQAGPHNTPSPN
jgi:hypothetical protein